MPTAIPLGSQRFALSKERVQLPISRMLVAVVSSQPLCRRLMEIAREVTDGSKVILLDEKRAFS